MLSDRENQFGVVEPVSVSLCRSIQLNAAKQWDSDRVQEGEDVCLGALMGAEPPRVVHCHLSLPGAPLSWHGCFGAGTPGEGLLAPSTRLADGGCDFKGCKEDGVKAALLIQLK